MGVKQSLKCSLILACHIYKKKPSPKFTEMLIFPSHDERIMTVQNQQRTSPVFFSSSIPQLVTVLCSGATPQNQVKQLKAWECKELSDCSALLSLIAKTFQCCANRKGARVLLFNQVWCVNPFFLKMTANMTSTTWGDIFAGISPTSVGGFGVAIALGFSIAGAAWFVSAFIALFLSFRGIWLFLQGYFSHRKLSIRRCSQSTTNSFQKFDQCHFLRSSCHLWSDYGDCIDGQIAISWFKKLFRWLCNFEVNDSCSAVSFCFFHCFLPRILSFSALELLPEFLIFFLGIFWYSFVGAPFSWCIVYYFVCFSLVYVLVSVVPVVRWQMRKSQLCL